VVDPVVISVVKGEPTPEELAALVTALMARAPEQPAARVPRPSRWRASGLRGRAWQAPAAWSSGARPWVRPLP
jgi:Acyl-CoA carboxylase epsilon subunit